MNDLFPLKVVVGQRFCNRLDERASLETLINEKTATAIISPRRYGKSSLVHQVISQIQYPFCYIDLLTCFDDNAICLSIKDAVSELISKIMPANIKTIKLIETCFKGIKASLHYKGIGLEFSVPEVRTDPVKQVLDILKGLDSLAAKLKKTVVIFMDEFQQILETTKGFAILASIRSVAQVTKNISFIFSGSSRHMLSEIFDDSSQPFYMMCEKLFIGRIEQEHYIPYIQSAAKKQWEAEVSTKVIDCILSLTERHPFYVNYLCRKLWHRKTPPTTEKHVEDAWQACLGDEERRLIVELDKLTNNQKVILKAIANSPELKEPTAIDFLSKVGMASGTVTPAIKTLQKKDYIFVDQYGVTRVLDPLLKYLLVSY